MEWISALDPRWTVCGLPWHAENDGTLARLPLRADNLVRPEVRGLGRQLSGGRIRFRSDTAELSVRVAHSADPCMWNMHRVGSSGLDLYVGATWWGATNWMTPEPEYEYAFFSDQRPVEREFTLYLPLYNDLTRLEIGLSDGASVLPPLPFALPKPVVYYGSSITMGGCASRPGNAYPAILSRRLNLDMVNLGMSGNGLGEPEVASLIAEIDAACFVLDFHINVMTADELRKVYLPFYEAIRQRHPDTPMLMLSQIFTTRERFQPDWLQKRIDQTAVIREAYSEALRRGDQQVHFVDGTWLIGPEDEGVYVDGVHPNDRGFFMIADRLEPVLRDLLLTPINH